MLEARTLEECTIVRIVFFFFFEWISWFLVFRGMEWRIVVNYQQRLQNGMDVNISVRKTGYNVIELGNYSNMVKRDSFFLVFFWHYYAVSQPSWMYSKKSSTRRITWHTVLGKSFMVNVLAQNPLPLSSIHRTFWYYKRVRVKQPQIYYSDLNFICFKLCH